MKHFYSLALAAFICVLCSFGATAQDADDATILWSGNKQCNWSDGINLPASLFDDVAVGDQLKIYVDGVGFNLLLGGENGLTVPCYSFPDNVTYIDGVATYTMIADYAKEHTYTDGDEEKTLNVFEAMSANGVDLYGFVRVTRIEYIKSDIRNVAVGHGTPYVDNYDGWSRYENIAGAPNVEVVVYKDNHIRLNGWAGVEGYDIIINYNDSDIKSITPIYNGFEDETVDGNYWLIETGNDDDFIRAYISPGQSWVNLDKESGSVFFYGYMKSGDLSYYYIEWPLTADEITAYIEADYTEDCNIIQGWENALNEIRENYPEYAASEEGVATLSAISDKIAEYPAKIEEAKTTAVNRWGGYESPLTEDIKAEIDAAIGNAQDAAEAFSGIESITMDVNGESHFFDIYGRPVANPTKGSFVIKVANGVATKVLVK